MTGVAQDLARAKVMLDLQRYGEAASLLAHVVAAAPADSRAWCLLANAHLGTGQYDEAVAAARQAATLAPSDDWPYRLASIAHRHLGKPVTAWKEATEACRLAPDQWQSQACLAEAELARQVDFKAAEQAAAKARELAPNEPEVHYVSGLVSYARPDSKAARAHQERALALNPAHSGAMNELGRIKLRQLNHAGAARHFIQAARSAPGVSAYSRNVDVVVRRVVARMVYLASIGSLALYYATRVAHLSRAAVVTGLVVMAALSAGFGALQLRWMPPETRPLFRTRRVVLALAIAYGALLIAVVVAAVTPARALPDALLAAAVLIMAARFAAYAILRRKPAQAR